MMKLFEAASVISAIHAHYSTTSRHSICTHIPQYTSTHSRSNTPLQNININRLLSPPPHLVLFFFSSLFKSIPTLLFALDFLFSSCSHFHFSSGKWLLIDRSFKKKKKNGEKNNKIQKNCCNFQRLYINTEIELLRVFKTEPRLLCVHYTHTNIHKRKC